MAKLNAENYFDLVLVDYFSDPLKTPNWSGKRFTEMMEPMDLMPWLDLNHSRVQYVFHLGANSDTTETNSELLKKYNLNYSQDLWNSCVKNAIPLVYASSAATYGDGSQGFDDEEVIDKLQPLNLYGNSKQDFDMWALAQEKKPMQWVGLKFFNVYRPNEEHKKRMASVIKHAFDQISASGVMKLFKSHRDDFKDGEQLRDFIYVKDVVDVCFFLMHNRNINGIFNLGSGVARSFKDLVLATFDAMKTEPQIEFIEMPVDIRDKYQYFTQATMAKLAATGYNKSSHTLEEGVADYVQNYLLPNKKL